MFAKIVPHAGIAEMGMTTFDVGLSRAWPKLTISAAARVVRIRGFSINSSVLDLRPIENLRLLQGEQDVTANTVL
jgi:hypothetical protein